MSQTAHIGRDEDYVDWDREQPLTAARLFEICAAPTPAEAAFIDSAYPHVAGERVRFRYDDDVLSGFVDWIALSKNSFLLVGETEMHQALLTRSDFGGYLSIGFTLSGSVRHSFGGGEAPPDVSPPYCVVSFYPEGFVRGVRYAKGSSNRSVGLYIFKADLEDTFRFPLRLLPSPLRELMESPRGLFVRYLPCPVQVVTGFSEMTASGISQDLLGRYLRAKSEEMLCLAIDLLARSNHAPDMQTRLTPQELSRLQTVREALDNNLAAPPSLDAMCEMAGMNRNKLADGFRYLFGVSPVEYSRRRRMEHAFRLLQSSGMPITRIADEVGFAHSRNLASAFRKYFNVSLLDVRRSASASGTPGGPLSE